MSLDFVIPTKRNPTKSSTEVLPKFVMRKATDLMVRGGDFYAVWVESKGLWSTDEQDAIDLVDKELFNYVESMPELKNDPNLRIKYMWDSTSGSIDSWHKYCQKQMRDNYVPLDESLIFSNTETTKESHASKRLPYPLEPGSINAWDKIISTLYSPTERHKIEWAIGAIVTGASKDIQKFMVFYGSAGTGKSTIMNIIQDLFEGYYAVFDAKALGSSNNQFALEAFKTNPLVAIQHDGDLSRIEDNTKLNSLVSHEYMTVNEKYKSTYQDKFNAFLFMGTNKPVKITDGKSGLLRRLIDVVPSGNKLSFKDYKKCTEDVKFELGAIAWHCKEVFLEDPEAYDDYVPTLMMGASNDFYNFVIESYSVFKKNDGTTLNVAYEMYKNYVDDAKVAYPLNKRAFKEELKNYFEDYQKRIEGDSRIVDRYIGFKTDIFEQDMNGGKKNEEKNESISSWLQLTECGESVFDRECAECFAQYASDKETPQKRWDDVSTKLKDLDTSKIHYVRIPENHVVIDFDLKDKDGNKSFELNYEAASKWPATYAEVSKGGAGIHLHYIYTGDPTKLKRLYAEDIEVKVFTGKSSLRRRLSKCNNLDISTITSGLPLKEVKMIDKDVVQSEKGLRTTIKQCLNKEHHGATAPEVSFIFKILDDAYNSGMHYDVSDMKGAVTAFAMDSTNQADKCLKQVAQMHFKSDEPTEDSYEGPEEAPIAFYDIEIFPNLALVNYKMAGKGTSVVRMINPKPEDIEAMCKYRLIGFNNRRYDNHLIYAMMMGYDNEQLYNLSQKIINGDRGAFFAEAYNLSYTDIYDFASAGNKKSLKKLEIEMGNIPRSKLEKKGFSQEEINIIKAGCHHKELGLPWDQPVPEERWIEVAEYCDNDVLATEAAFTYLRADWTAREILADISGLSVNASTNTQTTRIIFGKNKNPQNQFNYRNLAEPVFDIDEDMYQFLANACPKMMEKTHGPAGSLLPYFPGYKFENGKSTYRGREIGEGGNVYAEPGMYGNVALLDIASMHPHSTIAECLFGVEFTTAYRDIVEGRVGIKHQAWEDLNGMLGGRLTKHIERVKRGEITSGDLANALKTAINSVYGLTAASFDNPFRDKRNIDNIVAKRGALFMEDLKHAVQERGFTVAHIKTDSIKIPDATPEIIEFVMEFGERYGYTFEHEATYDRMCLVNDAVYIAKYKDPEECVEMYGYAPGDNKKHKDDPWTATGKQFAVPYVFKSLFSKDKIEFEDLCETFSVSKGDLYLDMNEGFEDVSAYEKELDKLENKYKKGQLSDTTFEPESLRLKNKIAEGHNYIFVGRVGEFTPVIDGSGGGVLYRIKDGKPYNASGASGYRWMESETVKSLGMQNKVDYRFYDKLADDAVDVISKYGDFEWFVSDDPYISKEPVAGFMAIPDGVDEDEYPFDYSQQQPFL